MLETQVDDDTPDEYADPLHTVCSPNSKPFMLALNSYRISALSCYLPSSTWVTRSQLREYSSLQRRWKLSRMLQPQQVSLSFSGNGQLLWEIPAYLVVSLYRLLQQERKWTQQSVTILPLYLELSISIPTFILLSDHKPLKHLFKEESAIPAMASAHIQH